MWNQPIPFDRVLRCESMKRGWAVDKSGKRWRGFVALGTDNEIRLTGRMNGIGLCWNCRGRVYEGWECIDIRRDLCDWCVIMPPESRVLIFPDDIGETMFHRMKKELFRNAIPTRQRTRLG